MASRHRVVHLVSFFALVLNLFAPLATVEAQTFDQLAAFNNSTPEVEYSSNNDDEGEQSPEPVEPEVPEQPDTPEQPETPVEPEAPAEPEDATTPGDDGSGSDVSEPILQPIAPQNPVITTTVCEDEVTTTVDNVDLPTEPAGVTYAFGPAHGDSLIDVTATIDSTTHTWDIASVAYEGSKWSVNADGSASYSDAITPCPEVQETPDTSGLMNEAYAISDPASIQMDNVPDTSLEPGESVEYRVLITSGGDDSETFGFTGTISQGATVESWTAAEIDTSSSKTTWGADQFGCDVVAGDISCNPVPGTLLSAGHALEVTFTVRVSDDFEPGTCPDSVSFLVTGTWSEFATASDSNPLECPLAAPSFPEITLTQATCVDGLARHQLTVSDDAVGMTLEDIRVEGSSVTVPIEVDAGSEVVITYQRLAGAGPWPTDLSSTIAGENWVVVSDDTATLTFTPPDVVCDLVMSMRSSGDGVSLQDTFAPGDELYFRILMLNLDSEPVLNLTITDQLDSDLGPFESGWTITTFGAEAECNLSVTGLLTCEIPELGPQSAGAETSAVDIRFSRTVPEDGTFCGDKSNSADLYVGESETPFGTSTADFTVDCSGYVGFFPLIGHLNDEYVPATEFEPGDSLAIGWLAGNGNSFPVFDVTMVTVLDSQLGPFDDSTWTITENGDMECRFEPVDGSPGQTALICDIAVLLPTNAGTSEGLAQVWLERTIPEINAACGDFSSTFSMFVGGEHPKDHIPGSMPFTIECGPRFTLELVRLVGDTWTVDTANDPVDPGSTVTYGFKITNTGDVPLTGMSFESFVKPASASGVWEDDPPIVDCSIGLATSEVGVNCLQGSGYQIAPNAPFRFRLGVTIVDNPSPEVCNDGIVNNVEITAINNITLQTPVQGAFTTELACDAETAPELDIEKTVVSAGAGENGDEFSPGDEIDYSVVLSNTGDGLASEMSLVDSLPGDLGFKADSISVTVSDGSSATCDYDSAAHEISCEGLTVPAQSGTGEDAVPGTITLEYTLMIPSDGSACGPQTNTALYEDTSGDETGTADAVIYVLCPEVSLDNTLEISRDNEPVTGTEASVGDVLNFTIIVTNTGEGAATGVSFEDLLQAGLFGSNGLEWNISAQYGTACGFSSGVLSCEEIDLDPLADYSVTLTSNAITATNPICGEYTNGIAFTGEWAGDGSMVDYVGTVSDPVAFAIGCAPDATITKVQYYGDADGRVTIEGTTYQVAQTGEAVDSGDYIAYEISIVNTGGVDLGYVHFVGNIPAGTIYEARSYGPAENLDCSLHVIDATLHCASDFNLAPEEFDPIRPEESVGVILIVRVNDDVATQQCEISNHAMLWWAEIAGEPSIDILGGRTETPDVVTDVNCVPVWSVEKKSDTAGVKTDFEAGDEIEYTITVSNDGPLDIEAGMELNDVSSGAGTLTDWEIDGVTMDPQPAPEAGGYTIALPKILMGDPVNVTATYSVTQADIDAGMITNCATVNDIPADDNGNCVTDTIDPDASVDFHKERTAASVAPGIDDPAVIEFTLSVHNDGNITVDEAVLSDDDLADLLPASPTGTAWTVSVVSGGEYLDPPDQANFPFSIIDLPPEETVSVRVSLGVPLDIELPNAEWCKPFHNTAELAGTFANGDVIGFDDDQNPATPNDPLTADATVLVNCTGLSIEKSAIDVSGNPVTGDLVTGQQFSYQITVANNGNAYVGNIVVSDQVPEELIIEGVETSFDSSELGGEICDVPVENLVECGPVSLSGSGESDSTVTITIDVKVPERGAITWEQCTDISNSAIINKDFGMMVPSSGITPPGEADIWSNPVDHTIDCATGLTLEKSASDVVDANENGRPDAGETITYTFTLANTGDVSLYNVEVIDPLVGLDWQDGNTIAELEPGETNIVTLTATYQINQNDLDAGIVENCADAVGSTSSGATGRDVSATSDEDDRCATTFLTQEPALEIDKQGSLDPGENNRADAGDVITYTFEVTNTGNVTIVGVLVGDPLVGLEWQDGSTIAELKPGETNSDTLTATYQINQNDLDAGIVENCADAVGSTSSGDEGTDVLAASDDHDRCATTFLTQEPGIEIDKQGSLDPGENNRADAGDVITYTFEVTNTGNVTIVDVLVSDPLVGLEWQDGNTIAELKPGETNSVTITATYQISQNDLDAGMVENCADAVASTSSGATGRDVSTASDENDRCATTVLTQEPALEIDKQGTLDAGENNRADAGDVITYTFEVTNTGNVTIADVVVSDPLPGLIWDGENSVDSLAPGVTISFSATYAVTNADIEAGERSNVAAVSGMAPEPVSVVHSFGLAFAIMQQVNSVSDQDEVVIPLEQVPGIALTVIGELDLGADGQVGVDDVITYTFTVSNTGNIGLTNIVIIDPLPGLTWHDEPTIAALAPGEQVTLTASYALSETDLEAGTVQNCADATAGEDGPTAEACEDIDVPYVPVSTPDATPDATPDSTPVVTPDGTTVPTAPLVDGLPQTGQGGMTTIAATLWAAAALGVLALGAAALGTRRPRSE